MERVCLSDTSSAWRAEAIAPARDGRRPSRTPDLESPRAKAPRTGLLHAATHWIALYATPEERP